MGGGSHRRLDLLFPVGQIHMRNIILWRMNIRVILVFPVLNLQDGCKSLLTEGDLIPSGTAGYDVWVQVKLIGVNGCAHDLR